MSGEVFHQIYLHIVWHTKNSQPLVTDRLEPAVFASIREKCKKMRGVSLHGIGGTATHVHLVVDIKPTVIICDMIGELKGSSAHDINQVSGNKVLEWQNGYGVVSFTKRDLKWVLDYVMGQKEHHAKDQLTERLERITEETVYPG